MADAESPDWAIILDLMYDRQFSKIQEHTAADDTVITRDKLEQLADLNPRERTEALEFMEEAGLLQLTNRPRRDYMITPQGFQVAHDRRITGRQQAREDQRNMRQFRVNRAIGLLTVGLLTVGAIDVIVRGYVGIEAVQWKIRLAMWTGFALALVIVYAIYSTGVLYPGDRESPDWKKRLKNWAESRRPESGGFVGVTDEGDSEIDFQTFLLTLVPVAFGMFFYTRFGPIFGFGAALVLVLIEGLIFRTLRYFL